MLLRLRLIAAALVAAGCLALAQEPPPGKPAPTGIEGFWEGPLKVGPMELRLVFQVKRDADAKLAAMLVSIDQGGQRVPCDAPTFADRKFAVGIPKIKAEFAGEMSADGRAIQGKYKQGGMTFPLELKRVEKPSTLNRPQLPKKPYPYREEEVNFENPAAGGIKLAGTLTLPPGDGPSPAVVLVSGSGPQDRDETLMGHKPFLVLADHLTRRGVAVLRYDDRGVAKSGGKFEGATSADFATDAHAAVTFLRGRPEIDPKRVGIAGHSEGGMIAPMVSAAHPGDVAFLILLAAPGVRGDEISLIQLEAMVRATGESADKVAVRVRFLKGLLPAAMKGGSVEERKAAVLAAGKAAEAAMTDAEKKLFAGEEQDDAAHEAVAARLADPWMHYFLTYEPKPTLRKVRCPVLALNGELDLQVAHGPNLAGVEAALRAGGNDRVTIKMFPGLNHLFQHAKTGALSEYGQIEETFAPEALEFLADWVTKLP